MQNNRVCFERIFHCFKNSKAEQTNIQFRQRRWVNYIFNCNLSKVKSFWKTLPAFAQSFFHEEKENEKKAEEENEKKAEEENQEKAEEENEEKAEEENEIESESEGEDELQEELINDPYWSQSNRPKNFSLQMKEFEDSKTENRKRKRTSQGTPNKKAREAKLTLLTTSPIIGMTVWIHFSTDCACKKSTLACTCDVWYCGQVLEEKEMTESGEKQFIVKFYEDKTVERIKWKKDYVWWGTKQ